MGRHADNTTDGRATRRRAGIIAWGVTLGIPATVAVALWSASGTGDGEAGAASALGLTVTAGTASAQLYPGGTGDVVFSVTNPNPYDVSVTTATLGAVTGVTDCDSTNFTANTPTVTATTVPAGGSATVKAVGGITMKTTAGDGCQGVTVTVTGTLTGTQA